MTTIQLAGLLKARTAMSEAMTHLDAELAMVMEKSTEPKTGPVKKEADFKGENIPKELAQVCVEFVNLHWSDHAYFSLKNTDDNRLTFEANRFYFEMGLSLPIFHGDGEYFVVNPGERLSLDVPTLLKIQEGVVRDNDDPSDTWSSLRGISELDRLFSVINGFDWQWWPKLLELVNENDPVKYTEIDYG